MLNVHVKAAIFIGPLLTGNVVYRQHSHHRDDRLTGFLEYRQHSHHRDDHTSGTTPFARQRFPP